MALSRTAVLLLLLPAPAVVDLAASTEEVSASTQCLPSAEAVQKEYPGSWASWTTHAPDHRGQKCWFPAARENHSRHIETVLRRGAQTAQTLVRKEAKPEYVEPNATTEATTEKAPEEAPFVGEMTNLGWSFRTRSTSVGPAEEVGTPEESSFDDRFAAARDNTSVQKPSLIQRMMDPVGAIPNIP